MFHKYTYLVTICKYNNYFSWSKSWFFVSWSSSGSVAANRSFISASDNHSSNIWTDLWSSSAYKKITDNKIIVELKKKIFFSLTSRKASFNRLALRSHSLLVLSHRSSISFNFLRNSSASSGLAFLSNSFAVFLTESNCEARFENSCSKAWKQQNIAFWRTQFDFDECHFLRKEPTCWYFQWLK